MTIGWTPGLSDEAPNEPTLGPVSDLRRLLAEMSPHLHAGSYAFTQIHGPVPAGVHPVASVVEDEGLTLVLSVAEADALGLAYDFVAAWITLEVTSALSAVGLTAAVSAALASVGISCNMIAGFSHDHVFVPLGRAPDALAVLNGLAFRSAGRESRHLRLPGGHQ